VTRHHTSADNGAGMEAGKAAYDDRAPVLVGWLVTLPNGYECRLGADKARADHYAAQQHATLEPMFVMRAAK
jgi:hypothetical protein